MFKKTKKFQTILFDLDNTLLDFSYAEMHSFISLFEHNYSNYDAKVAYPLYKEINEQLWKDYEGGRIEKKELQHKRFETLGQKLGLPSKNYKKMAKDYLNGLIEHTRPIQSAYEVCEELSRDFRLAIITNGVGWTQRERLKRTPLESFMEAIVISEEAGFPKPDPKIFEHCFEKLGRPKKEETLIVGDRIDSDILGGENFGISTCWFSPHKQQRKEAPIPTFSIKHLDELPALLKT